MMQVELMPGGVWMGGYSVGVLHGHGKGVLVFIAWELGTAAWQAEMALGPLAHNSLCALPSWQPLSVSGQCESTNVLTFPFSMY